MSANHKRPLLAFVLVALACSMIIANGVRTQADVVSVFRAGAQHLVAGVELVVSDKAREPALGESEPQLTPVGSVEVAAQQVFGGGHSVPPAGHRATPGRHAKAHHAHSRSREEPRGHPALGRPHGHGHDHVKSHVKSHHKSHGKSQTKNSGKRLAMSLYKGLTKSHGKAHLKSHGKGHGKSHLKSHGKGHSKGH